MQECGLVLNLHGECPSDASKVGVLDVFLGGGLINCKGICVLNAEEKFLEHLKQLHTDFPKLKIVLEHATTKAAVDMVRCSHLFD